MKKQSNTIGQTKVASKINPILNKQKEWAKSLAREMQLCTVLGLKSDFGYDKRWSTARKIEFVLLLYYGLPMTKSHVLKVMNTFERGSIPVNFNIAFYSMIVRNQLHRLNLAEGNNVLVVLPNSKFSFK